MPSGARPVKSVLKLGRERSKPSDYEDDETLHTTHNGYETKLTAKRLTQIIARTRKGAPSSVAGAACGVSAVCIRQWLFKGRRLREERGETIDKLHADTVDLIEQTGGKGAAWERGLALILKGRTELVFGLFAALYDRARADFLQEQLDGIVEDGDAWQRRAWLLERLAPGAFSQDREMRRERLNLMRLQQEEIKARLAAGQTNDPTAGLTDAVSEFMRKLDRLAPK